MPTKHGNDTRARKSESRRAPSCYNAKTVRLKEALHAGRVLKTDKPKTTSG